MFSWDVHRGAIITFQTVRITVSIWNYCLIPYSAFLRLVAGFLTLLFSKFVINFGVQYFCVSCLIFLLINILYCLFFFSVPFLQRTPQPSWEGLAAAFSLWTAEHLKPLKKKKKKIESFWCLFVFFWFSLFFFLLPLSLRLSSATVLVSLSTRSVATWMSLWWVSVLGSSKFPWTHCNKKVPSLYFCFFSPSFCPFLQSYYASLFLSIQPSFFTYFFPPFLSSFSFSLCPPLLPSIGSHFHNIFVSFRPPPHTHITFILPTFFHSSLLRFSLEYIYASILPLLLLSYLLPPFLKKRICHNDL